MSRAIQLGPSITASTLGPRSSTRPVQVDEAGQKQDTGLLDQGVIAIHSGSMPTLIDLPGSFVAVLIGVTVSETEFATYSVFPSGATTLAAGLRPTLIGFPALLVAVVIGVTVCAAKLAT